MYFGINYYLQFQQEREKALKAMSMAHQAQLKMLRYQLNPHFLFNTLNAISTLVLDKDTVGANGMLGRLSSFLRYTLVNQPTQKVSLEQELYALELYLDIEKVRFEDHLRLVWQIDEDAKRALMPSLLLQPLIENAVKYAIAPSEEGGMIAVSAGVENGRLILKVRDDGPGLDADSVRDPKLSSGVGIANIRERLTQIYGDDHGFELRDARGGGLEVVISIPCELAAEEEDSADDADDEQEEQS
jgi:LytS/YehU family sensor histidine kinase